MASEIADLYDLQNGVENGGQKAEIGDIGGRIRFLKLEHAFEADVLSIADTVKLAKLPKGARVVDWFLYSASLGTTGIFNFGWAASTDATEAADADGFAATLDAGGQAVNHRALGGVVGLNKKFEAAVDVQIAFTEATNGASADALKGYIAYVID